MLVQAAYKKESEGVVKKQRGSVGIVPQLLDSLTVLVLVEEDFR